MRTYHAAMHIHVINPMVLVLVLLPIPMPPPST